jgi:hypothetical protein
MQPPKIKLKFFFHALRIYFSGRIKKPEIYKLVSTLYLREVYKKIR